MGGFGRTLCVGVPFALTIASLICLLIVGLAGITKSSTDISLFKINTENFTIASSSLSSLIARGHSDVSALTKAATAASGTASTSSINITAADLSLADSYTVTLWNYCGTTGSSTKCSTAQFDWAKNATNTTAFSHLAETVAGANITLPDTIEDALKTFSTVSRWAEIVYIIALIATVLELVVGIFALCSRVGSCVTFIISGFSTVATIAASTLVTVMAAVVVGSCDSIGKWYGVSASFEPTFLAITWLAVAFSIASGLFWMLSMCCCSPARRERRDKHRSKAGDMMNTPYVGYEKVHDPFHPAEYGAGQQSGVHHAGYGSPMTQVKGSRQSAASYEPYSHHVV